MITLPEHIAKCIYRVDKNAVWRCFAKETISIDTDNKSSIKSLKPFIIEQGGRKFLLTSNRETAIPVECDFAILINHQINSASFARKEFEVREWLKHPA